MWVTKVKMSIGGGLLFVASLAVHAAALKPDPAWQEGKLDNGFTWQFLSTPQRPNDTTELRLVVSTGSLMENSQQIGFSTLIPQIAQRYSPSLTSEQFKQFWQQIGGVKSSYPMVVNSYGLTLYSLSLPNNRPDLLKEALAWLADSAGRLPINDETISSVVAARHPIVTYPVDLQDPWWRYRLKGSAMLGHDPVSVSGPVSSEALAEFYKQSYTPDAMKLYIVGNVDARSLHEQINKQFSPLTGKRETPATIPTLMPLPEQAVNLIGLPGSESTLSIIWDQTWSPVRDDKAQLRYWLADLAREAIFERLLSHTGDAAKSEPHLGAGCTVLFQRAQCAINLSTPQDKIKPSLEKLAKSLREMEDKGLSHDEFNALLSRKQSELGNLFEAYGRMDTVILMNQRMLSQQNNVVDISPENYKHLRQVFLSSLTEEMLNQQIKSQISTSPVLVLVQPEGEPESDVKELQSLYMSIVEPQSVKDSVSEATGQTEKALQESTQSQDVLAPLDESILGKPTVPAEPQAPVDKASPSR